MVSAAVLDFRGYTVAMGRRHIMDVMDAIEFVKAHWLWFAVAAPFVIGYIAMKILG